MAHQQPTLWLSSRCRHACPVLHIPGAPCSRRQTASRTLPRRARGPTVDSSTDIRSDLWAALFQLGAQRVASVADQATAAAADAATKVQRYLQPPPPGFPPGPSGDQSVALLTDPLAFLDSLQRQHNGIAGFLLGGERVVLVSDPAAAKQVLVDQPDVFVKEGTAFFPGSSLTGNGLLVSDGAVWQRQRRLSNPAFRQAAVDKYAAEMVACTQQLMEGRFAAGGVQDVYAAYNELTLDITLAALFGMGAHSRGGSSSSSDATTTTTTTSSSSSSSGTVRPGADDHTAAAIVSAVEKAFAYFTNRGAATIAVPEWVPTPDNREFQAAVQQLDSVVYGIIAARRADNAAAQQWQPQGPPQAAAAGSQAQHTSHATSSGAASKGGAINSKTPNSNSSSSSSSGGGGRPSDLLQALLDAKDDSGAGMSDAALRDELMTLLVAGQETSAILLGWATALLAAHPEVQDAAAVEVQQVLQGAPPTAADVGRLPGVLAVVLEALRCYPPAYLVGRCANRPVELGGRYALPAGTTVLVSPYLLHKDATRWHQPGVFRPARWLPHLRPAAARQQQVPTGAERSRTSGNGAPSGGGDGPVGGAAAATTGSDAGSSSSSGGHGNGSSNIGSTQPTTTTTTSSSSSSGGAGNERVNFMAVFKDLGPNGAYVPFGGGPRNCIGTGFAMMEAVLVLAALLQRYEVRPEGPSSALPSPKPLLTLRPDGVRLRIVARKGPAAAAAVGARSGVLVSTGKLMQ